MLIRDAERGDLPGILEIYNDAVTSSTAVWTDAPEELASRERWFEGRRAGGFPVLVAVDGARVVGYATFGDFRTWPGYRHTVEHSVYVRAGCRRTGIGRALMGELIDRARRRGAHAMVGGIEAGNEPSLALHRSLGFHEAARLREVGCKFGRWLDLVLMELLLDSRPSP